jgi:hypothetical protein
MVIYDKLERPGPPHPRWDPWIRNSSSQISGIYREPLADETFTPISFQRREGGFTQVLRNHPGYDWQRLGVNVPAMDGSQLHLNHLKVP